MSPHPIPGWYHDPDLAASAGALRWWDGRQWTGHRMAPGPPGMPGAQPGDGGAMATASRVPAHAGKNGRLGQLAMLVNVVIGVIVLPLVAYTLSAAYSDFVHFIGEVQDAPPDQVPPVPGSVLAATLVLLVAGPLNWVALGMLMFWSYRSATAAAALRIPSRQDPMWAIIGWIIPVLSYWYPYLVVRDCLPADHPWRRIVGWWWAGYLVSSGGLLYLIPAALVGTTPFLAAMTVHVVVTVLTDRTGARIAQTIDLAHQNAMAGARPKAEQAPATAVP